MMARNNINMTTTVKREDLLAKLKEHAAQHREIVKEARQGYLKKAQEVLEIRLKKLTEGKIVSLHFTLSPPQDYSETYSSVIAMVEANTKDEIDLQPDEFRQLYQGKWDWSRTFLVSNSIYSKRAEDELAGSFGESVGGASE